MPWSCPVSVCSSIVRASVDVWRMRLLPVALSSLLVLGACAATGDAVQSARDARQALTPTTPWLREPATAAPSAASRPHDGEPASIARWWQHFDDPLLASLIDDAQQSAPTVAIALARVREAQAQAQMAGAGVLPSLGVAAGGSRGASPASNFVGATQATAGLQAQWEIDLFGGQRAQQRAAASRAEQARLDWHDARVTLAAEVAQTFVNLRACEALTGVFELAAQSTSKTAELTREKVRVGFEAPANAALAEAAGADAANRLAAQRADCEALHLALTLLSGRATPALRQALQARRAQLPQPGRAFDVDRLPASVLAARPDIAAAEQALAATESDLGAANAARWPRLVFSGNLGHGWLRVGGVTQDGAAWSIVPSVSLPILDGGRISAGIDAAKARREAAHAALDARIRGAVREVEEALVRVDAARARESDALRAAQGFRTFFEATEQRWRLGAANLIEMEDARRLALNAQAALIGLQRERIAAWVSLYRAVGGGWRPQDATAAPAAAMRP